MDTPLVIVLVALAVVVLWAVLSFNRLVRLRNEAAQGFSGIEVQLKRRANLVPNLVQAVQGYASHERATLEQVTVARSHAAGASGVDDVAGADAEMRRALGGLFAVAEAYPQLQADANFLQLQEQLEETEDRIAAARRYYNAVVQRYNSRIQSIPDVVIARPAGFEERAFYRVEDDADREAVPVRFGSAAR